MSWLCIHLFFSLIRPSISFVRTTSDRFSLYVTISELGNKSIINFASVRRIALSRISIFCHRNCPMLLHYSIFSRCCAVLQKTLPKYFLTGLKFVKFSAFVQNLGSEQIFKIFHECTKDQERSTSAR